MPKYKIHPAIGIARVGNSPTEFFIGPERRWEGPQAGGQFKDAACRIKRQAARFRIFEHPDDGSEPFELILAPSDTVTWTANLHGNTGAGTTSVTGFNHSATIEATTLVDPSNPALGHVLLSQLRTDADGHLLVLGGFGWTKDGGVGGNDDTCDGAVSVSVTTAAGKLTVEPAWVVIAPPKFAPEIESPVTLWDWVEQRIHASTPFTDVTSYTNHIYPILLRASRMGWLLEAASGHHAWDLTDVDSLPRDAIFNALKVPVGVTPPSGVVGGTMPLGQTLTPLQYGRMRDFWANENFINDWTGEPVPHTGTPGATELDRAALDACVGGPFLPGIEVDVQFTFPSNFVTDDPGRVNQSPLSLVGHRLRFAVEPGWPGDYNACGDWLIARPSSVVASDGTREDWNRGADTRVLFFQKWATLGFVVKQPDGTFREASRCKSLVLGRVPRLTSLLDRIRRFIDIVDPPPPEVGRLRQLVEQIEDLALPGQDTLSRLAERLDNMSDGELKAALVEAQSEKARADAAVQLIQARLQQPARSR